MTTDEESDSKKLTAMIDHLTQENVRLTGDLESATAYIKRLEEELLARVVEEVKKRIMEPLP